MVQGLAGLLVPEHHACGALYNAHGMLLPLLALRALFLPEHFWETLPMAARCAAMVEQVGKWGGGPINLHMEPASSGEPASYRETKYA